MSAHTLPRPLPHLTIGTLGHPGHGKTTLAAALSSARGAAGPYRPAAPGAPSAPLPPRPPREDPEPRPRRFRYTTDTRRYTLVDPAGGTERLDGAILAVSVLEGVRPGAAEHLALARRSGPAPLVVALTMADQGRDEQTELVELDVRALLTAYGHTGETLPVVRVSARRALEGDPRWKGTVEALLDAVDTYVPLPGGEHGAPGCRAGAG
ncbi:hypothetical protein FM076_03880 [Streptomyces albus subsp. chlorinus]|uniref:GTP-binding protein n=1 Tax=Streptomyces albus TaxID=1888 RepID=UPI00156D7433|nr:GTP-binding protein [Streptomyces albus]NSC20402.1 hypothetical protein [Streptomyces albus subsp. chlorinus]